ncbi:MAG: ABC transporter substrate-binding protein [Acidobacteriota bacterium]
MTKKACIMVAALVASAVGSAALAADPIKIGVLTSFSGTLAPVGQQVKMGIELAAKDINAGGGILKRPIQLVFEDDESNPQVAARKAEKLYQQDKVDFITGTIHSGATLALAQIAERNDKLAATTVSYSSNITGAQCNPNMFRVNAHAGMQAAALTTWLGKNVKGKRYVVVAPDYEMGKDAGAWFEAGVKKSGGELVGRIDPPLGAKDFSTYFGTLRTSRPDVLITLTPGNDTVRLLSQMKEYGLIDGKLVLAGAAGAVSRGNIGALQGAAENFLTAAGYSPDIDTPQSKKFVAEFQAMFGNTLPDLFAADSYSVVTLVKVAAEKAGSFETAKLRAAIRNTAWDTPQGRKAMRPGDNQADLDMYIIQVKGQDFTIVDRVPAAQVAGPDNCARF